MIEPSGPDLERTAGTLDRRARRTRSRLHAALGALIHRKPYDRITVSEILASADIGRSTFYDHFHDKHELLASSLRDLLRAAEVSAPRSSDAPQALLAFSLPLFEHIERHRDDAGKGLRHRGQTALHRHLERWLVEWMTQDPVSAKPHCRGAVTRELLARYLASNFVLVLEHWLGDTAPMPAAEADALFRALVEPTIARQQA
jgi:AcrR family transcriptional regulator